MKVSPWSVDSRSRRRWSYNTRCFISILVVLGGVLGMATAMDSVTLASSLRQNQTSLCPGETVVSFKCRTNCTRVYWRVGDPEVGSRLIAFDGERHQVGILQRANSNYATLLQCSPEAQEEGCTSVLFVAGPTQSGMNRVECYNGSATSIVKMIQYYHGVADLPSEPGNITVEHSNEMPNLFTISWTPGPTTVGSQLSHYIVQLDGQTVWVQNPPVSLYSEASNYTINVRLQAVDACGQTSPIAFKATAFDPATENRPNSISKGHRNIGSIYITVALALALLARH